MNPQLAALAFARLLVSNFDGYDELTVVFVFLQKSK